MHFCAEKPGEVKVVAEKRLLARSNFPRATPFRGATYLPNMEIPPDTRTAVARRGTSFRPVEQKTERSGQHPRLMDPRGSIWGHLFPRTVGTVPLWAVHEHHQPMPKPAHLRHTRQGAVRMSRHGAGKGWRTSNGHGPGETRPQRPSRSPQRSYCCLSASAGIEQQRDWAAFSRLLAPT